jgi:hypothetical protein
MIRVSSARSKEHFITCITSSFFFNVQVKVTLRLTVSRSVCLDVEPTLGLLTRCYFLSEGFCMKFADMVTCSARL